MRQPFSISLAAAASVFILSAWPHFAQASQQLAVDKGCYGCHGAYQRGDAPSIERLSKRLSGLKGDDAAQQKFVVQYQAGELLQHIGPHERLTPESAKTLIHWLAEGAK